VSVSREEDASALQMLAALSRAVGLRQRHEELMVSGEPDLKSPAARDRERSPLGERTLELATGRGAA